MKKIVFILTVFMLAFGTSSSVPAGCNKEKCYDVIDNLLFCLSNSEPVNNVCKNEYSNDIKSYCNCNQKNENDAGNIICDFCEEEPHNSSIEDKCELIDFFCGAEL